MKFCTPHSQSILMITLDSCRYDTFESADCPNLKSIGPLYKAMSPGNFTYASHAAMFVGFTPGVAERTEPFVNPKFGKIFRMVGVGFPSRGPDFVRLAGRNIIEGLSRQGYLTVGAAAVHWFDPDRPTSRQLIQDFDHYWYAGEKWLLERQLEFIAAHLPEADRPVFVFLNIGETHVPYWHQGADWDQNISPCVAFGRDNDAAECRRRQRACLEYVDRLLGPLLGAFSQANILACADHGDCWGEDGLWDHGIHHPKVYEVLLLFRLLNRPAPAA
jgi:hypothetical protein